MKRLMLVLLLALPAGCTSNPYPTGSAQAFCWKQANNDPAVRQLVNQQLTQGGPGPYSDNKIRFARQRAMQNCLLAKGSAPPGGVEPVERY